MRKLLYLIIALCLVPAAHAQSSAGIISSARATDWTKSGIPGGIPSGSWTQCGATMPSTSTAAQINTRLASCSPFQYVLLGPGTFSILAGLVLSNTGAGKSYIVLRGSGGDSTFLVFGSAAYVSCQGGNGNSSICASSGDGTYSGSPPANICDVTAGLSQGSTTLTLSGSCNMGNFVANQTMVTLDQADDGYSFPDNSFTIATSQLISNLVTITTATTNNLSNNQNVWITGARAGFNVDTTLTEPITVVNGTTFTFPLSHVDIALAADTGRVEGLSSGHATDNGGFFNVSDKWDTKVDISAVTCGGGNATYAYVYNAGYQLPTNAVSPLYAGAGAAGEPITITGLGNAGNNGSFTIASRALGTFTAVNAGCVPATTQTGTGLAGPVGRTSNGPDHFNQRLHRNQNEVFLVTNIAGNVITLNAPIVQPNWVLGQSPQVWLTQGNVYTGVEDLSMDLSAITVSNSAITWGNSCYGWAKGVRILSPRVYGLFVSNGCNMEWENNYLYRVGQDGGYGDAGAIKYNGSHHLFQNNIIHRSTNLAFFAEGPTAGTVIGYNFTTPTYFGNSGNAKSLFDHATNRQELLEGNHAVALQASDGIHGSSFGLTLFRNFLSGWESCANGVCGGGTTALIGGFAFASLAGGRYPNVVGNVLGTPNLSGGYVYEAHGSGGTNKTMLGLGLGNGNISSPDDPLVWQTIMKWGNWDVVTNATRWCGNSSSTGWGTTCASASEIPTGDAFYPNSLPTVGDVGAGQAALPASFYLAAKPAWFGSRTWPGIGPDVTLGNVGQCPGTQDTVGLQAKMPATLAGSCAGAGAPTAAWGGHVNANPAMDVYLNTMGGLPDGSGPALTFNENYYAGGSIPIVTLTTFPANFGSHTVGVASGSQTFTLTNTGTATLTYTGISVTGTNAAEFSITGGTCSVGGGTLTAGSSCTVIMVFTASGTGLRSANLQVLSNATSSPDLGALSGTGQASVTGTGSNFSLTKMIWKNNKTGVLTALSCRACGTGCFGCFKPGQVSPSTKILLW